MGHPRSNLHVLVPHSVFYSEAEREVIVPVDTAHFAWFASEIRTIFIHRIRDVTVGLCVLRHFRPPEPPHGSSNIGSQLMTLLA